MLALAKGVRGRSREGSERICAREGSERAVLAREINRLVDVRKNEWTSGCQNLDEG